MSRPSFSANPDLCGDEAAVEIAPNRGPSTALLTIWASAAVDLEDDGGPGGQSEQRQQAAGQHHHGADEAGAGAAHDHEPDELAPLLPKTNGGRGG